MPTSNQRVTIDEISFLPWKIGISEPVTKVTIILITEDKV